MPICRATTIGQLGAQRLGRRPVRAQHDEADDGLALHLVGHADDAGLGDRRMADQHRLDLRRAQPLAGDLQRVVRAALDEPEAVVVDDAQSPWTQTSGQRDQYVSS